MQCAAMPSRSSTNQPCWSASAAPGSPSTASGPTRTPVRRSVGCPCGKVWVNGGSSTNSRPSASASTMNNVGPYPAQIATTMCAAATSPLVTNHFSPSRSQPPAPSGVAVVRMPEGSEPACSSVTAYEIHPSPRSAGRR